MAVLQKISPEQIPQRMITAVMLANNIINGIMPAMSGNGNKVLGINNGGSAVELKEIYGSTGISISHSSGRITITATGGVAPAAHGSTHPYGGADPIPLASAQIFVGNSSGYMQGRSLSGDATLSNAAVLSLANSGVASGVYGSSSLLPVLTIDAKGRITSASTTSITGLGTISTGVWQGTAIADGYIASAANWNTAYNTRLTTLNLTYLTGSFASNILTLSLPQNVATTAAPTYAGMTLNGSLNAGSNTITSGTITVSGVSTISNILIKGGTGTGIGATTGLAFDAGASTSYTLLTLGNNNGTMFSVSSAGTTTLAGDLFVNRTAANAFMYINTVTAGMSGILRYRQGGVERWSIYKDGGTESGSDNGSDLNFLPFSDAGASKGILLTLKRSDKSATFSGNVNSLAFLASSAAGGGVTLYTAQSTYTTSGSAFPRINFNVNDGTTQKDVAYVMAGKTTNTADAELRFYVSQYNAGFQTPVLAATFKYNNFSFATNSTQSTSGVLIIAGSDSHSVKLYPSLSAGAYNPIVQAGDQVVLGNGGAIDVGALTLTTWSNTNVGLRITNNTVAINGAATFNSTITVNGAATFNSTITVNGTGTSTFASQNILPNAGYYTNIGSLSKKYLTIHAAELWVENLVAQNTQATIGGRILVGPTTQLIADLAPAATSMDVKYSLGTSGTAIARLEANGSVEFIAVNLATQTIITGGYRYAIVRDLDGTGANQWYAGDAVFSTGNTGSGFIDIYSVSNMKGATISGPTIVGNIRNSITYNDWSEAWAIGNLDGLYGYTSDIYGAGFGKFANSSSFITIDPTNGIRFTYRNSSGINSYPIALDMSGNATFAGTVTANAGKIGYWNIDAYSIYSNTLGSYDMILKSDGTYESSLSVSVSAVPRVWFGIDNYTPQYGLKVWNAAGLILFSAGDSNTFAGWTFNTTQLYNGSDIILDASAKKISINSATFGTSGIQIDYNSGTPRAYIGNGSGKYFQYDGTNISWAGVNTSLTTAGLFTATNAVITGTITANAGHLGHWNIDMYSIYSDTLGSYDMKLMNDGLYESSISVSVSSIPRVWLGIDNYNTVYGLKVYNSAGDTIFSAGDSNTFAGWSFDTAKIYNTNLLISSSGYISFGSTPPTAYGNNVGAWIGYTGGYAKLSLYSNSTNYMQWDGTALSVGGATITAGLVQTATTGQRVVINHASYLNSISFWADATSFLIMKPYTVMDYVAGLEIWNNNTGGEHAILAPGYLKLTAGVSGTYGSITLDTQSGVGAKITLHTEVGTTVQMYTGAVDYTSSHVSFTVISTGVTHTVDLRADGIYLDNVRKVTF